MSQPFRVGIVGCGKIAPRHIRACLLSPRVELGALVDPVLTRARDLARRFAVAPVCASAVSEALPHLDGIVVAVPNHRHRDVAVECLAAGVPVLIEKPLATSVAEGMAICEASQQHRAVAAVAYVTRFGDNVQLMHELLGRGHFGAVRRFAYQSGSRGSWSPLSAYNLDRQAAGGGVLVVTGTHFLDRMLAWFGYPDEMSLQDDALGGPEANAIATFRFLGEHRCEGITRFSKSVSLPPGFVMQTDKGVVVLHDRPDAEILLRPDDLGSAEVAIRRRTTEGPSEPADTFVRQLENFVDAVQGTVAPMVSAEQGLASLRLIEKLYASRTAMAVDWYSQEEREVVVS